MPDQVVFRVPKVWFTEAVDTFKERLSRYEDINLTDGQIASALFLHLNMLLEERLLGEFDDYSEVRSIRDLAINNPLTVNSPLVEVK